ncbi:hypothetical protein KVT40_004097 [Elsinoe batatas]|uniref:Uncharacterized protein n=1 Tax=Elsinoe batatas TaxID=2601811 RepID=A0A8K0L4C1_9PEZI|nr:hypothetical protein KVT40_004097 [Elsinoe batatas]
MPTHTILSELSRRTPLLIPFILFLLATALYSLHDHHFPYDAKLTSFTARMQFLYWSVPREQLKRYGIFIVLVSVAYDFVDVVHCFLEQRWGSWTAYVVWYLLRVFFSGDCLFGEDGRWIGDLLAEKKGGSKVGRGNGAEGEKESAGGDREKDGSGSESWEEVDAGDAAEVVKEMSDQVKVIERQGAEPVQARYELGSIDDESY